MRLSLPPKYACVPPGDLYGELSDALFRTLAQLHGLAWRTRGERTPPLTVLELADIRGLQERQMYNHLRDLKDRGRIRVESLGDGRIIIFPLRWEDDGGAAFSPGHEALTLSELEAQEADAEEAASTAKNCSDDAENRTILDGLRRLGIKGKKREQLAALPHVGQEGYLAAWARWFEGQSEFGAGFVVRLIESGDWPPDSDDQGDSEEEEPEVVVAGPASDADRAMWAEALERLRLETTKGTFDTWLSSLQVLGRDEGTLVLAAQNRYQVDWLRNRMEVAIRRALASVCGRATEVSFVYRAAGEG